MFGLTWTTPWPDQKDLFSKFVIREIQKFPCEKLTFFLTKLYQKCVLSYTLPSTGDTPYHVWIDLDDSLTRSKRHIFKVRYSRNTKISVWETNFFPKQFISKMRFVIHSTNAGDTPCQVCFDLDNSLTQKKPIFKNRNSRNTKFPCEKLTFFLAKL